MKSTEANRRLPRNFHKTFMPERSYLSAIMKYAASDKCGDIQSIAQETGIPTGKSSGKVAPALSYARGMGLILPDDEGKSQRQPKLSSFGRVVFLEDLYLKHSVTQWICHFQMCDFRLGADVWYKCFVEGFPILGVRFSRNRLEDFLASNYQVASDGIIGPLVRMYQDFSSFGTCGALREELGYIHRNTAPIADEFARGYGAWLLQLMDYYFSGVFQVTVTDLNAVAGWQTIPGWNDSEAQQVLDLVEYKGLVRVDRQMNPWILKPNSSLNDAWRSIYDDLV